jgi:hypothetical protein
MQLKPDHRNEPNIIFHELDECGSAAIIDQERAILAN